MVAEIKLMIIKSFVAQTLLPNVLEEHCEKKATLVEKVSQKKLVSEIAFTRVLPQGLSAA